MILTKGRVTFAIGILVVALVGLGIATGRNMAHQRSVAFDPADEPLQATNTSKYGLAGHIVYTEGDYLLVRDGAQHISGVWLVENTAILVAG